MLTAFVLIDSLYQKQQRMLVQTQISKRTIFQACFMSRAAGTEAIYILLQNVFYQNSRVMLDLCRTLCFSDTAPLLDRTYHTEIRGEC